MLFYLVLFGWNVKFLCLIHVISKYLDLHIICGHNSKDILHVIGVSWGKGNLELDNPDS